LNAEWSVLLVTLHLFLTSVDKEGFGEYLEEAGYININTPVFINSEDVSTLCGTGGGKHLPCRCLL